ncbi:MAG: formate dehydrogenase accessory sulfurtransferase FdhD, partial [Planctomycetes bacterium]|nr:formate dehydrogenase accessory sulfurtransferase FdhD [Planctomycetota bacterium]
MDPCKPSPIRRLEAGRFVSAVDPVVQEARIELDLNDGELRVGMLCLPLQLEALAIGFLLGEGILRREDLRSVQVDVEGQRVSMRGDFDADAMEAIHRRWTWGTGCGTGGTSRDLNNPTYAAVGAEVTMGAQAVLEL